MRMGSYNITFTVIFSTPADVTTTTAHSFIISCSFAHLVRSHFLTAEPYNETHNHYCSKVSCFNPLPNDFPLPKLSHNLYFLFLCSNYTVFVWPPGCPLMQRKGIIKMIYECNPPPNPPPLNSCPLALVKYGTALYHPLD